MLTRTLLMILCAASAAPVAATPLAPGAEWSCVSAPVDLGLSRLPTDPQPATPAEFDVALVDAAGFEASGTWGTDPQPFAWSGSWINLEDQLLLIGQMKETSAAREVRGASGFVNPKGLLLIVEMSEGRDLRAACHPQVKR